MTESRGSVATRRRRSPDGARAERARGRAVLRAVVLLAVLGAWLAVGAYGGMAQGTLSEVQENDQAAFLPESAESTRAGELADQFIDSSTLPALVVIAPADGAALTEEDLAAARDYAEQVPSLQLPDGTAVEQVLTGPPAAVPAEDGEAVLVPVSLDAEAANETLDEGDRVVGVVVDELRALSGEVLGPAELQAWVTGPGGFVADLSSAFAGIDGLLLAVALVVVLVILVAVYRSPILPVTVLLTAVLSLCAAALVVKPLAANGTLLLNGQSQGIMAILVIGAATDYSLLLVARYREELTRHEQPHRAMATAWRASLPPVLASAGTVIVGLLCLLLSDLASNASLGPVGSIGIASAVLGALTLLPALLLALGPRSRAVFWPRPPRHEAEEQSATASHGVWGRVAAFVARHDRPVWVATAVVLLAGAAFVPTFQAQGTSETATFLDEVESVTGAEVLSRHFEAGQVQPAVVIAPEPAAEEIRAAAEDVDGVERATLLTEETQGAGGSGADMAEGGGMPEGDAAPEAPGAQDEQGEPVVVDGQVRVEVVTDAAAATQEAADTVRDLREAVQDVEPDALVGGAAAERLDTQATAAQDLRTIVPAILLAIFAMLALLLRSLLAPLVLLVANLLSFGATLGVSALVFNHVLQFPGADPTVPLYGFVFLIALGIDYSIFLMTRVREETLQSGTRPGVRRGLAVTGGVITSAGLVLAATFSALSVIPLLFMAQLAFIVGFGVLVDTFVVRSLLVPGVAHDLGRRTWWPRTGSVPAD